MHAHLICAGGERVAVPEGVAAGSGLMRDAGECCDAPEAGLPVPFDATTVATLVAAIADGRAEGADVAALARAAVLADFCNIPSALPTLARIAASRGGEEIAGAWDEAYKMRGPPARGRCGAARRSSSPSRAAPSRARRRPTKPYTRETIAR